MTEPKQKLTAQDLMTPDVVTVAAGSSLADAMETMDRLGYSQLPVLRDGKAVGLLTERDVRRALADGRLAQPVAELASPVPPVAAPETRLSGVLRMMQEQEAILVMAPDGHLAGIITYWDLLVLSRPPLMVKEVELILRRVVAIFAEQKYGPDWWSHLPFNLREQAEQEHKADRDTDATPEHLLGHTSLWALIEICRNVRPDLGDAAFQRLHRVRQLRNKVAHLYVLTAEEEIEIRDVCTEAGDWLVSLLPPGADL